MSSYYFLLSSLYCDALSCPFDSFWLITLIELLENLLLLFRVLRLHRRILQLRPKRKTGPSYVIWELTCGAFFHPLSPKLLVTQHWLQLTYKCWLGVLHKSPIHNCYSFFTLAHILYLILSHLDSNLLFQVGFSVPITIHTWYFQSYISKLTAINLYFAISLWIFSRLIRNYLCWTQMASSDASAITAWKSRSYWFL